MYFKLEKWDRDWLVKLNSLNYIQGNSQMIKVFIEKKHTGPWTLNSIWKIFFCQKQFELLTQSQKQPVRKEPLLVATTLKKVPAISFEPLCLFYSAISTLEGCLLIINDNNY